MLLLLSGIGSGVFSSPNTSSIMSSIPPNRRGVAAGMMSTFMNSGTALSIGIFFSLLIAGLAGSIPAALYQGLVSEDVNSFVALEISKLPPVSTMFAALLGYNPMKTILAVFGLLNSSGSNALPSENLRVLVGQNFFPNLISMPFHDGLIVVFATSAALAAIAAFISGLRPTKHALPPPADAASTPAVAVAVPAPVVAVPPYSASADATRPTKT